MDPTEPVPALGDGALLTDFSAAPNSETADMVREHAQAVKDALAPWHASYDHYNFAENPVTADAVLPPDSYRRIQAIKTRYDPDDLIVTRHPV